jgi:hypothetical protein
MADSTYNLNGGFKSTMKRFADLDGPDFFPTPRWATFALTLLKSHLVEGIPRQRVEGNRRLLEDIRLITGERLVFDGEGKRFSVG